MKVRQFNIVPNLPDSIRPLRDIAMNLWSSWNWPAAQLFIRLDSETWEKCRQNLVMTLGNIPQKVLEEAAQDESFTAYLDRVWRSFQRYLQMKTWFEEHRGENHELKVAYFSMEFGMDVGLPIYSGGLGILAGDHLKSSSDLGVPLMGVGLLYQQGFFQQYLNSDGWQLEKNPINDWYNMPVTRQQDEAGKPLMVSVDLDGELLKAHIWRVNVGRIALYLLDANIPDNPPHLRQITAQLYAADRNIRLRQSILLGIGGVRALRTLGIRPTVFHMNEGHSAFMALERARILMEQGMSFQEAWEIVWASTVFTTHTPVPAGNEVFNLELMRPLFQKYAEQLGMNWDKFIQMGLEPGNTSSFSMTVLALRMAAHCNGVSRLHGQVSRRMWQSLWPALPADEIPIGHITNGIHTRTWLSHDMDELFERYIGPQFIDEPHNHKLWERVDRIPDLELWRIHQIRKERLIFFARKRLIMQLHRRGAGFAMIKGAEEVLSSRALTIGFARRFAGYKRANLLLRDPDRLRRIILDPERPVQIIFAGKAHPADNEGKELIRRIVHFSSDPAIANNLVFIEDYDINVARYMVQGVDVWLSNPRRPLEASGTSGMKAAANGAISVSTLDGWWDEAYRPEIGWAIGGGETDANQDEQDRIESEALYNLLEHELIPLYYDLDRTEIPRAWIARMKLSMKELGQQFNTHRMVMEYTDNYYIPAHRAHILMDEERHHRARELAAWHGKIAERWQQVTLTGGDEAERDREIRAGDSLPVRARVGLNGLAPEDVAVEVFYGPLDPNGEIIEGRGLRLQFRGDSDGKALFEGAIPGAVSGRMGFALRIRAHNPGLVHSRTPLWLKWE